VPLPIEFVDIAGLVRGAASGSGLGARFLGNIRDVPVVAHVVRCHAAGHVEHVDGAVDPVRDFNTIETELQLADLEGAEKALARVGERAAKRSAGQTGSAAGGGGSSSSSLASASAAIPVARWREIVAGCAEVLASGRSLRAHPPLGGDAPAEEWRAFHSLNFLTAKPMLVVCNIDEDAAADGGANDYSRTFEDWIGSRPGGACV
jgi:ribosome-binding ATPase YchF (GTP1/OBG family)